MKNLIKATILLLMIVALTDCKKFGKPFDVYFFTDIDRSKAPLILFIDNDNKGELPNIKASASPGNDTVIQSALHLSLKSGKYKIEAKDSLGNVKCDGTLKFTSTSLRVTGTAGGQDNSASGRVIISKLYY